MAAHFSVTYGRAIETVRAMCHLVGDLIYDEDTLIDMVRASVGEVFSRTALLHERYWVKRSGSITVSSGAFTSPDDTARILELEGVDADAAVTNGYREASVIEVYDEYRRTVDSDDTNDLVKQDIFSMAGGKIRTSRALASITIEYVFDPVVADAAATVETVMSCPSHLAMTVYQLTAATILNLTSGERAQFMEGRALATINKFVEGTIQAESHAFRRKQSYTKEEQVTAVMPRDY